MEYQQAIREFEATVNKTIEEIEQKAQKRGFQAANVLTNEVKKVLSGQRSGRKYKVKGTGGKSKGDGVFYTASAPGVKHHKEWQKKKCGKNVKKAGNIGIIRDCGN